MSSNHFREQSFHVTIATEPALDQLMIESLRVDLDFSIDRIIFKNIIDTRNKSPNIPISISWHFDHLFSDLIKTIISNMN